MQLNCLPNHWYPSPSLPKADHYFNFVGNHVFALLYTLTLCIHPYTKYNHLACFGTINRNICCISFCLILSCFYQCFFLIKETFLLVFLFMTILLSTCLFLRFRITGYRNMYIVSCTNAEVCHSGFHQQYMAARFCIPSPIFICTV